MEKVIFFKSQRKRPADQRQKKYSDVEPLNWRTQNWTKVFDFLWQDGSVRGKWYSKGLADAGGWDLQVWWNVHHLATTAMMNTLWLFNLAMV